MSTITASSIQSLSNNSLFIGDLSKFCSESELENLFAKYGQITDVKIKRNNNTGKTLSYGFVTFASESSATNAMNSLDGSMFFGRKLRIRWAMYNTRSPNPISESVINSVYVRYVTSKVDFFVTEEEFHKVFDRFGSVLDVSIKESSIDKRTNRQSGYGFVHFACDNLGVEAAFQAVAHVDNATIEGVSYNVELSKNLLKQFKELHPTGSLPNPLTSTSLSSVNRSSTSLTVLPSELLNPAAGKDSNFNNSNSPPVNTVPKAVTNKTVCRRGSGSGSSISSIGSIPTECLQFVEVDEDHNNNDSNYVFSTHTTSPINQNLTSSKGFNDNSNHSSGNNSSYHRSPQTASSPHSHSVTSSTATQQQQQQQQKSPLVGHPSQQHHREELSLASLSLLHPLAADPVKLPADLHIPYRSGHDLRSLRAENGPISRQDPGRMSDLEGWEDATDGRYLPLTSHHLPPYLPPSHHQHQQHHQQQIQQQQSSRRLTAMPLNCQANDLRLKKSHTYPNPTNTNNLRPTLAIQQPQLYRNAMKLPQPHLSPRPPTTTNSHPLEAYSLLHPPQQQQPLRYSLPQQQHHQQQPHQQQHQQHQQQQYQQQRRYSTTNEMNPHNSRGGVSQNHSLGESFGPFFSEHPEKTDLFDYQSHQPPIHTNYNTNNNSNKWSSYQEPREADVSYRLDGLLGSQPLLTTPNNLYDSDSHYNHHHNNNINNHNNINNDRNNLTNNLDANFFVFKDLSDSLFSLPPPAASRQWDQTTSQLQYHDDPSNTLPTYPLPNTIHSTKTLSPFGFQPVSSNSPSLTDLAGLSDGSSSNECI
eukprot:CAMPEP_0170093194 /NCGR_PEP_ID=MMETSP0019_2-20121128/26339_1 /TAXON_ID=98059 /ORGANISM="Dinobryon sp., Strain UTEXLB2267" /LENGTH=811 /DNA_ID=CAMNT_0010313935 /DNA_START=155 /DNA_END=2590 /DNA_ORIENTATION=+